MSATHASSGIDESAPRVVLQSSSSASTRGWIDEGPVTALGAAATGSGLPPGAEGNAAPNVGSAAPPVPTNEMHFRVLLRQNREQLDAVFQDVSDPKSSKYGQHLSAEQLRSLVSPSVEDQARVTRWLRSALSLGTHSVTSTGDSITVEHATPAAVEKAFGCVVHRFREEEPPSSASAGVHGSAPFPPQRGATGATPSFVPRVVLRCVGDVRVPAAFTGLVTGTSGLIDMPVRHIHGGPHPHPRPHDPAVGEPLGGDQHQQPQDQQQPGSQQQPPAADPSQVLAERHGLAPQPMHNPLTHPHQTFRTKEQLNHVALEFEREQLERKSGKRGWF